VLPWRRIAKKGAIVALEWNGGENDHSFTLAIVVGRPEVHVSIHDRTKRETEFDTMITTKFIHKHR